MRKIEREKVKMKRKRKEKLFLVEYCVMHIHEEFAEHLLCTGAELCITRDARLFVKYSDKLTTGRFLKCKCANLESLMS